MTMKDMFSSHDDAVSPVVGVMLMLVVTIIIAAVVSAFAGGLAETEHKAPQMTLGAEAHEMDYILIEHLGGDPIDTSSITVRTFIPSGTFADMNKEVDDWVNQTYCPTNDYLYNSTSYSWAVFQPGDLIKIDWVDAFAEDHYGTPGGSSPGAGESLFIEIYDSTSGKIIVNAQTIVLP